jgi:hypothetical protein
MHHKRHAFNPKRQLVASPPLAAELEELAGRVRYGGNAEHKSKPGDFGLVPPASPRRDKTLCDEAGIFTKAEAVRLLSEGVRRGLISEQKRNGFPQNIWSVSNGRIPLEAQLENQETGVYHGYPMPQSDVFSQEILKRWKRGNNS